jgi:hypothetical protein
MGVDGQAADAPLHAGASDEEWRRRPLLFAPLIPAIFGVLAPVIPEWSAPWAIVNACLLAGWVAYMTVIVFRGGYRSPKLRVAYTISQLDLLCFFMTVTAWRGLGSKPALAVLFFGTLVAAAALAHRFRRATLQELSEPRSRFGLFHAGLGALGAGTAGVLGYTAAKGLPGGALGVVLFLVALYIVVPVHTLWVGAEDPDWRPARRAGRRRA